MLEKNKLIEEAIKNALKEDIGEGDYSSLACIPKTAKNKAKLIVKDSGVLAGVEIAELVFSMFGDFTFKKLIDDGLVVKPGDIAFEVEGSSQGILACERLVLNIMQRMSGIATKTQSMLELIKGCSSKILDTRKTTPNFRVFEKEAVRIGGGVNHRFALYDMIMLKDNHIDFAGGINQALLKTDEYLKNVGKKITVEIEVRDFKELNEALECGLFNRVMLDNFTPSDVSKALKLIDGKFETEASGGITEYTLRSYAKTGVDYISIGALTHQVKSLDLSLKAV
jgi:nicotinate-nucleotide pyrophosphorylase (carboxylating)